MGTRIKKILMTLVVIFVVVALIQLIFFSSNINESSIINHSDVIEVYESDK